MIRKISAILVIMILLVLTSGCIQSGRVLREPSVINYEVLRGEYANQSVKVFPGDRYELLFPNNTGRYHIYTATTQRGDIVQAYVCYVTNEPVIDRFGTRDNFIYHGCLGYPEGPEYLGISNENTIINSTIAFPEGAMQSRIVFIGGSGTGWIHFDVSISEVMS